MSLRVALALIYYRGLENRVSWVRVQPEQLFSLTKRVVSAVIGLCCGPVDCSSCIVECTSPAVIYRHVYSRHVISPQLTVRCRRMKTAPCEMARGSATTDHQFSYFTPDDSNSVYSYQWSTEKWEELPPCPYYHSGLVIINGQLTAVGGRVWTGVLSLY